MDPPPDELDDENIDLAGNVEEQNSFIYAVAPNPSSDLSEQISINTTPAFQCIDEVLNEGKITGVKAAHLKSKYQDLLQHLKHTRELESKYLHEGKELMHQIQKQQATINQGELFPAGTDNDATRLRTDLLKYSNELSSCNERIYQLDFKIDGLHEEKLLLEKELQRLPKKEEIDKQIKDYSQETEELKLDIAQRLHECRSLKDEYSTMVEKSTLITSDLENLEKEEQQFKDELVKIYAEPAHISKQCELIHRQQRDYLEKNKIIEADVAVVHREVTKVSDKKRTLLKEKEQLARALAEQRGIYIEKEKEVDLLIKECDLAQERQAELLGDRTSLDVRIKHAYLEKRTENDIHTRKCRERDRDLKTLKKAELHYKVVKDAFNQTQLAYDKAKSQVDAQPKDDGTLLEKRAELQREVDLAKRAFSQQNAMTAHEKQLAEKGSQEEHRLLCEQGQLRVDVVDLMRLAQIRADEREHKARDFLKAELKYHKANDDLRAKEYTITDHNKKNVEVQKRLEDFAKLYDIIKNERNKCVNLIQTSTQKAAEMHEKVKILQNEIEILRTASAAKERQLQKSNLKHSNAVILRDGLRHEVSKHQITSDDLKDQIEQQRLAIAQVNDMINKAEENMVELRRRYESSVQDRNHRGIQLIERNEEVCVLYEKVNVQETVIRNGTIELHGREEEIRFLKMEAADLQRQVNVLKSSLPNKRALDNEYATLHVQFAQCQDYVQELEQLLEDPSNAEHVRNLGGSDPSAGDLQRKIEDLEMRLAQTEEQFLEKELVYEQINRLVGKVKNKTMSGKEDTLSLAKKVNDVQAKIKDATRKMMAMVSELSMNQANALKLSQEIKGKETHLEQCYARMERGQPPSDVIEQEWLRCLRNDVNNDKAKIDRRKADEEMEHYKIPSGITTTAEPRPNAYIPDDGNELPLPRPYGASAPFKPTELGSNMRHIRKPAVKPIEV